MMQRSKKGLSTIVGAIFLVAIIFAGISVINWGVGLQDNYALTISERNQIDWERLNEKVELTDLSIDNNKFNITLQNTGTLPARLVRLWVTNETSNWHQKYDTNYLVNPTTKLTSLGQSLSLNALSTQDYVIGVVTERGNLATFRAASSSNQALNLNLHALPSTVSAKFQATLMLSVNNNLTNVDVIPKVTPITDLQVSAPAGATYTKISGPTPVSDKGLLRGETTFFRWIYEIDGSENQVITFTASLVGGKPGNTASASVTIKKVETSKISEQSQSSITSLSAASIIPGSPASDGSLFFHVETTNVPTGTNNYQMQPMPPDKTNTQVVTLTTGTKVTFFTRNATENISIPAGKWNLTLWYTSGSGSGDTQIKVSYNITDANGNNQSIILPPSIVNYPKSTPSTSKTNSTSLGAITIIAQNRLKVTLEYVSGPSLTLQFDTDAKPTNLATPAPTPNFPTYINYKAGDPFFVLIKNTGTVPIWIDDDSRIIFKHVSQSSYFAGIILEWQDPNTNPLQTGNIDKNYDSKVLLANSTLTLKFSAPNVQPVTPSGAPGSASQVVGPGTYDVKMRLSGHDSSGAFVIKIIPIGVVVAT